MNSIVGDFKPKLHNVIVEQFIDSDKKIMMRSKFYYRKFNIEESLNKLFIFILETDQENDVEHYFKNYDTNNLHTFTIITVNETNIFKILNKVFSYGTKVKHLIIDINKCPTFIEFYEFLSKLTSIENISMINLCFLNDKIPTNMLLPIYKSLKKLTIRECQCTHFVNKKMLYNVINDNKQLYEININSYGISFEIDIIKFLKKKQMFHNYKSFDQCDERIITINFEYTENLSPLWNFNLLFFGWIYHHNCILSNYNYIQCTALKKCKKCNKIKKIQVGYRKIEKSTSICNGNF
uniref:RNI-like protein n=1 Tax=Strongyloides stercoralis TaxID=6248 RepID=A0A0K0ERU9_STRER